MNVLVAYLEVFKKARPYSLFVLAVLLLVYMLNQLDRYALSITSVETAQELKYGDKACMPLAGNVSKQEAQICSGLNETLSVFFFLINLLKKILLIS